jgi:hypothetical protein
MPRPTDAWVRLLLAPAVLFVACGVDRNYQTDLWHHLARGRLIVAEGRLVDDDRFTYTVPGRPFVDSNWGWQVVFYRLYEAGGVPLLQAVNAAVGVAALAAAVGVAARRSGSAVAALAAGLLAVAGLWQQAVLIRPQTASFLLFALLLATLEAGRSRRAWLLAAPLILAAWVNCHGGFPVGLVLVGCYAVAAALAPNEPRPSGSGQTPAAPSRSRLVSALPWAGCLALCVAATLLNPYGWRVYEYVLHTSGTASARRIDEWLPTTPFSLIGAVFWLSLPLAVAALIVRRPSAWELVPLLVFVVAAFGAARMVAWWLLLLTPVLAVRLAALLPKAEPSRPTTGAALTCIGLAAVMVLSLPWFESVNPVFRLPGRAHRVESDLQAVGDGMKEQAPRGRLFCRFDWGEYFGWELAPDYTVFMDGRIEIYPDDVWAEYVTVTRAEDGWQAVLDRYDVDWLVLDESGYHHALLPAVRASPRWRETDLGRGTAVVFRRVRWWSLAGGPRGR